MDTDEPTDQNLIDTGGLRPFEPMSGEERDLWRRRSHGDAMARNELVEKYFGIVEANTSNVVETILSAIEESDFRQSAVVGFMEAIDEFDAEQGMRFEDFSSLKIRKAIIDELNNYIRE